MVCFVRESNYTYTRYALGYLSKTKEQNNAIHTCLINIVKLNPTNTHLTHQNIHNSKKKIRKSRS